MEPVPSSISKEYPQRGPLQQFRFANGTAFKCFRCGDTKKSRLIAIYNGNWARRLCNGCYGRLLSLYEVKAGTAPDDEKSEELACALLSTITLDDQRKAEQLFRASERRAECLSGEAVRFIATAEHVAHQLQREPNLEWSPAVIGLCKAVETEVVCRIVQPLSVLAAGQILKTDKADKDLSRVAAFCADPTRKPPELGTFAHFLKTVLHSQERRKTSAIIGNFLQLAATWTGSHWCLDPNGLHETLILLTTNFRNRAAHIDELDKSDYISCRELVIGSKGILWELVVATELHRKRCAVSRRLTFNPCG